MATHCDFSLSCTCRETVSYADHLTRFKLVAGLVDEEIKEDVLGGEEKTLEETVKTVEAKESAKRAKVTLGGGSSGQVSKVDQVRHKPCTHCGRSNRLRAGGEKETMPSF